MSPPPIEDVSVQYERAKREKEHEIAMLELDAKLAARKPKSVSEEIETSFNKYYSKVMGSNEFAMKQKAANAEKFKDNPEMLEMANRAVDQWLEDRM